MKSRSLLLQERSTNKRRHPSAVASSHNETLRGINHHLPTSGADPVNPRENLEVLWMIAERKEEAFTS